MSPIPIRIKKWWPPYEDETLSEPEDRIIRLYDRDGNMVHEIGAHFAVPGGKSMFSLPLSVSTVRITRA